MPRPKAPRFGTEWRLVWVGAKGKGGARLHRMGGGIRRRSGWVEERESPHPARIIWALPGLKDGTIGAWLQP